MSEITKSHDLGQGAGRLDGMHIRLLEQDDLRALEWDGEFIKFRKVYAEAYQRMRKGLALIWVAEMPVDLIIGQVFVQLRTHGSRALADGRNRAYVHSFRVRPSYRNLGVGTRLMATVEDDLAQRGFSRVCLNVANENEGAQHLYERLGYQVVSPERGRWSYIDHRGMLQHVHEPGWRMEKQIS